MVAKGRVENGVVVLAKGIRLSEGQEVSVYVPPPAGSNTHSILAIPSVSVGSILHPFRSEDDLLEEMLEGRP